MNKVAYITFGRFQPPTVGHKLMLDTLKKTAGTNDYFIFASQTQNKTTDPLNYKDKIEIMREQFPQHSRNIVYDTSIKTLMQLFDYIYDKGYSELYIVVGSDRVANMNQLIQRYNGVSRADGKYEFDRCGAVQAGNIRDPDSADNTQSISASKMREFVINNNYAAFQFSLPVAAHAKNIFNKIRKVYGKEQIK